MQAESDALNTIQVLVKTIYADEEVSNTSNVDIQGLAKDASEECIQILKEPEKSQARAATKILCAFMTTTRMHFFSSTGRRSDGDAASIRRYTISQVVPHFVQLFHNPDESSTRFSTLTLLSEVIDAARDSDDQGKEVIEFEPALTPYKDEVLRVYTVGLQSTSLRSAALSGLKAMIMSNNLLTDEEIGFIIHKVNDYILKDHDDYDDTRLSARPDIL